MKTKSRERAEAQENQAYNKQRNLFVTMIRKAKEDCYDYLNLRIIMNNKRFRKTGKSFFSEKVGSNEKITLIEEDKKLSEDNEVAETYEPYFEPIMENLGIVSASDESVTDIIRKFESYISIMK